MKKIVLLCLFSIIISSRIFAIPKAVPEKIQKIFHDEFSTIKNASFFDFGDYYEVYFKKENNSSEKVYYNSHGEIIQTVKYYSESELDPFIKEKMNKKYKGKAICGVTEVQSKIEHFYQIILEDQSSLYVVKLDGKSLEEISKRFHKG